MYRPRRTGAQQVALNIRGGVASLIVVYFLLACQFQASVQEANSILHTVIQGPRIFISVALPSLTAFGHLHTADERTKNLALEAISLSPIHILWSNVSHKKNLVTQSCLGAWNRGSEMGM